ncbi:clustered mitochondria protein-like [Salvia splendens]|uniref:clustered mitochondria protein-like n=1 Tax=Salvia splendens TaxID=180675 RepID=UPI001C268EA5|nr:clustered mitochondria protein-like [Salvia splendens]XP_042008507.1 clustered mitochondria protein-like [Salvia splendens]XP_042008514.1 clustered mitochondria protein-like [Salvia splendens]XP_042008517.1 clustered mitochondria protein-like [Salvia splendens]
MAGKSNKGKNRKGSQQSVVNPTELPVSSDAPLGNSSTALEANGGKSLSETIEANPEVKEVDGASEQPQGKQAEVHLYPVPVRTQGGEKLELQLSPGDSVMDVRQFLLDAPETCFMTCYDLLLHTKEGSAHHLEDYNEISEVADITSGSCFLEMVAALYDDRSIRAHVHRTRELLSLLTLHSSLSTTLALQHETGQNAANNKADAVKAEVPELENLGFMENVTSSLNSLLSSPSKEIKCVESIVFSSFNPPPSYRRLSGDLIYLDVATLEGNKYCVTGTTKTFYVNSSAGNILDPRPNKAATEATTLVGLLQKISPKFKKAFREILERKASAHPFENVQSLLPPNTWLGLYPLPEHKRDAARAENSLTLSFGSELIGMQRDWNEELQACWEFPHATHQERILRDRALYKVITDFVDAATSGAIGVISRCIPPINPTDPECFHMYVHNNIFFSFAVDADLEQLAQRRANEEILSQAGLSGSSVPLAGTVNGTQTSPDVPAEAQLPESEQATYASANNDLKGTKAFQEADVPGLYNLAMAIIDYRGHRVVAQSVLPGILQGDKSDSLLYGSVDNGKKICWSEDFHTKVLEASKRLHLKEHTVLDGSGNAVKLAAPVECKGIVGSDDRHYLLDLMRVTPRDANFSGPDSRFCILRQELITAFCHAEAGDKLSSGCESHEENTVTSDSLGANNEEESLKSEENALSATSDAQLQDTGDGVKQNIQECGCHSNKKDATKDILFNPNVFTEFKLAGNPEEIAADEENVRKASLYLKEVALPKFIHDLCTLEVSPMDGQTLTEALHAHGINVRYIGKVAEGTRHMPHMWDLCSNEIVIRSAKHVIKDALRDTEDHDIAHAISHFLNCFAGMVQVVSAKGVANSLHTKSHKKGQSGHHASGKSSKAQAKSKSGSYVKKKQSLFLSFTTESLWADIQEFAKLKYQFELPEDARNQVKKISVIRNLCQKVGMTIAARKYDFSAATPFQVSDILNVQPVVKHSIPICSEAKDLVETGKVQLGEGMLSEAYVIFSEAFTILQQVTGPMHREVANCCRYLAMVLYHAGDMAGAIMQQHKELIINERCLGLDHPDTAHSYGNMALFYHGLNQTELALRHMSRALLLLGLSSGPDHPDVAATFINVAMMYQDIGKMDTALRYLQEALKKNERLLGEEHIQTAVCYHALAIAFNCMGAFKLSHQHEKKTYDILLKQLGEDDSRTKDSQNWMKTFKMRELQVNAQKQKGQALNPTSAQKAIDIIKAHPDLLQAFQAAAVAGSSSNANVAGKKAFNGVGVGESFPRARGLDERAKKKAAAKALLVRRHGSPAQASPSGPPPPPPPSDGAVNEAANGGKKETNQTSNGVLSSEGHDTKSGQQDQGPVGLGTGLAALDAKKLKTKSKAKAASAAAESSN